MNCAALKQAITDEAFRLGFCAAGFAGVAPIQTADIFNNWLQSGMNAGMDYLARHQSLRADPRNLLPGAKSVIVTAVRYPNNKQPGRGFSTYARGSDYHDVIRAKLRKLEGFIRSQTTAAAFRICVDSAPIAERDWAIAAGIGWRGRQGQIISSEHGPCLLLGEILVDIEIEPSEPVENRCGECRLCQNACPTGALESDGLVDCRKCISYLTIEHKGDFTPDQSSSLGGAVFGCDICTGICPWNRKGTDDPVIPELDSRLMPESNQILGMTEQDFQNVFKGTPVERTGLANLQRNARATR